MKSKAFQFFALVSFCLYLAGCIPPRINYDAKSFADTAADTTPQQDADPSDDALGDQSANTDAEPDTIPPHDATTDGQSLVDAPQTPEDAAVDGIDDGSPFDGALSESSHGTDKGGARIVMLPIKGSNHCDDPGLPLYISALANKRFST